MNGDVSQTFYPPKQTTTITMTSQPPDEFVCPISGAVMSDPVTDRQGNVMDRKCVVEWLRSGKATSPVSCEPLHESDLRPVMALRRMIDQWCSDNGVVLSPRQPPREPVVDDDDDDTPQPWVEDETTVDGANVVLISGPTMRGWRAAMRDTPPIEATFMCDGDKVLCTMTTSVEPDLPMLVCCVVDVSFSMASPIAPNDVEMGGITVFDVVRHSVKTVLSQLRPDDLISVVVFGSGAREYILPTCARELRGQGGTTSIDQLCATDGSTDIWAGIRLGVQTSRAYAQHMTAHVLVFTDGAPNVHPPEGEIAALRNLDRGGVVINTFGFGCMLETGLLPELALVGGGGLHVFIPVAGMVGSAFINAISNLRCVVASNVVIEAAQTVIVGYVMKGQTRTVVFARCDAVALSYRDTRGKELHTGVLLGSVDNESLTVDELARQDLINLLGGDVSRGNVSSFLATYRAMEPKTPFITDVIHDVESEVFAGIGKCWGPHYTLSLRHAHLTQTRSTFKDPSTQGYGGLLFQGYVRDGDAAFSALPFLRSNRGDAIATPARINDSNEPCFHPDCTVLMIDGKSRKVQDLRPGMLLHNGAMVECLVCTACDGVSPRFVRIGHGGLLISPYHPVRLSESAAWMFPISVNQNVESIPCEALFNFVVFPRNTPLVVNGVECIGLGHGVTDDEVLTHPFLGTERVVDDLKRFRGFPTVVVHGVLRDKNKLICGFR